MSTCGPQSAGAAPWMTMSRTASSHRIQQPSSARSLVSAASEESIATTVEIIERATSTLQGLRASDALQIWRALGVYVQDQLADRRPVRIDQFGVFGLNESVEPVFLADATFLQTNRLRERERRGHVISTKFAPVARMNPQVIGNQYLPKCRKEIVAAVIANVVALVGKWAKQGRRPGIRLGFLPVGEWQCDSDGVVDFQFLAEFRKHLRLGAVAANAEELVKGSNQRISGSSSIGEDKTGALSVKEFNARSISSSKTRSISSVHTKVSRLNTAKSTESSRRYEDRPQSTKLTATSSKGRPKTSRSAKSSESVPTSLKESSEQCANSGKSAQKSASSVISASTSSSKESLVRPAKHVWAESRCLEPMRLESHTEGTAVFASIRSKLMARYGVSCLNAFERVLRSMARRGGITRREIKFGLRDLGVEATATELDEMMKSMPSTTNGQLAIDDILAALRGEKLLSPRRRELIERVYKMLDASDKGVVTIEDLKENYDASALPKVRAGKQTLEQALAAFIREWETDVIDNNSQTITDSCISLRGFFNYYCNVSACVAEDEEFERMIRQLWHISMNQDNLEEDETLMPRSPGNYSIPKEKDSNNQQVSFTNQLTTDDDEAEAWQYLEALLLPKKLARGHPQVPTLDSMCHRLSANRVLGDGNESMNTRAFAHALIHLDKHLEQTKAAFLAELAASTNSRQPENIYLVDLYRALTSSNQKRLQMNRGNNYSKSSTVVDKVRNRIFRRVALSTAGSMVDTSPQSELDPSAVTFHGLARSLRLMDKNGDQRLSKDELKTGLSKFGVDVNFYELDCLFSFFDTDHSGCISCEEFITGMRGEMNERRLELVKMAFQLLDKDGDGQVTLKELQSAYDCSKNPEVISGKLTVEDAIKIFAAQWETGSPDGIITRDEFETYYKNLSASIDSDDYFELMMRNAWHISGGEGQCANSTNRRVLVTNVDGSERVVEIRNDLGIKATDFALMRANLEAQGLLSSSAPGDSNDKPTKIDLHGYADLRSKKNGVRQAHPAKSKTPDRRFHRRGQFAQPEGGGRSILSMPDLSHESQQLSREQQRSLRDRAAKLIQSRFRGFRARKFASLVRRKMAAERLRRAALASEQNASKPRLLRAALRSTHGF